eukprot:CAMPEP_0177635254 /NCGR_PEP_ID=MMETSP0447-20121125/3804_1 /TAXON_ID=0 /ORGANISM="Stygamoeba regulata, Strain BSH-02190019" /LENGTH=570 /DNA_ID=CAMNT_0019137031 /DNA_START=1746 /DNA_END=3458 /DNA_ORIENTATION=-
MATNPLSVKLMLDGGRAVAKLQRSPTDTPREWFAYQGRCVLSARRRMESSHSDDAQRRTPLSPSLCRIYSEIYNTELVYLAQLEVIQTVLLRPAEALGVRCSPAVRGFVDGIARLVRLHADIVRTIELEGEDGGGLLMSYRRVLPFMKIYMPVMAGHAETELCLQELAAQSLHYAALLRDSQVSLCTLLIRPLQRVSKYNVLFRRLLRHTDPASGTVPLISAVCEGAHELAVYLSGQTDREADSRPQHTLYRALAQHLELEAGHATPFHLIREDTASLCAVLRSTREQKKAPMLQRTVTLLSVAVAVSVVTEGRYLVEEIAPLAFAVVEVCAEDALDHAVRVHWLDRGEHPIELRIAFRSAFERTEWLHAFRLLDLKVSTSRPQLATRQHMPSHRKARRGSVQLAKFGPHGAGSSRSPPPPPPPQPQPPPPLLVGARRASIDSAGTAVSLRFSSAREHRSSLSALSGDRLPARFRSTKAKARSHSTTLSQAPQLVKSAPTHSAAECGDVIDDAPAEDHPRVSFSRSAPAEVTVRERGHARIISFVDAQDSGAPPIDADAAATVAVAKPLG